VVVRDVIALPSCIGHHLHMIPVLGPRDPFPPLDRALRRPNGLLAIGRNLSVSTLVEAYAQGVFPWFSEGDPILWWSPDPRMVLFPQELHVAKSLARRLKKKDFRVTADTAFGDVIRACAAPRGGEPGTWINRRMITAYERLHTAGIAHSIETWMDGQLAGGLYGVAIGRAFFGESMFARRTDASKIALVHMVRQLERWGVGLIDCQMKTEHLATFGAREIPRREFLERVRGLVAQPPVPPPWLLEPASPRAGSRAGITPR
jgi:leucyl/phenylalanyl-tRNA--protein transferase